MNYQKLNGKNQAQTTTKKKKTWNSNYSNKNAKKKNKISYYVK